MPLDLEKSDWKPVTFGDVVKEVRQSTKDPVADGSKRVVGLEHIESECIHLRSWASIKEATTFTKVFRKGHVLFGRRRAYLKKAALADFNGICSGDITVMEAKDGLIPELLPFLVNNDKFFDYAVQHSAGGLSPRTKFKDLANYGFLLPPKDQQAKLADLLRAADKEIEDAKILLSTTETYRKTHSLQLLSSNSNWKETKLKDVAKFIDYRGKSPRKTESGIPLITAKNIRQGWIDDEPREYIADEDYDTWMSRGIPRVGDVLFTTEAPLGNTAMVETTNRFALAQRALCLQPNEGVEGKFLFHSLLSPGLRAKIFARSTGTTVFGIRSAELKEITMPVPPLEEQRAIAKDLEEICEAEDRIQKRVESAAQLLKSLINQIF